MRQFEGFAPGLNPLLKHIFFAKDRAHAHIDFFVEILLKMKNQSNCYLK